MNGRYYRPELDVVRFLAFLFVFFHHTLPWSSNARIASLSKPALAAVDAVRSSCGFGLSLFFTLSAFLICEILLREREASGTIRIKQFYMRRILRIWPLYYLGVGLALLFTFFYRDMSGVHAILSFLVFMGAWQIALHGLPTLPDGTMNPVNPLWSISVEEQFYLLVPWMVKYLSRKGIVQACLLIILVSNLCLAYLGSTSANDQQIWFNTFVQFECFAAGILTCIMLRGRLPVMSVSRRGLTFVSALGCWFLAAYSLHARFLIRNPGATYLIIGYLLVSLGSVLILIAFLGVNPDLLPQPVVYLGRISFGLYVFHEFCLHLTRILIGRYLIEQFLTFRIHSYPLRMLLTWSINVVPTLILTLLIAALSYRYFETPFLRMKKRHSIIESQPILEGHRLSAEKIAVEA